MVSVDGSVVVQILNLLLLIWILNMVLYKPVRGILLKRKRKVSGLESDVYACSQAVTDRDIAYADGIRDARLNGQKQKELLLDLALSEEKKIIGKINDDSLLELETARGQIETEINTVRRSLEGDIDVFAKAISHKILGRVV